MTVRAGSVLPVTLVMTSGDFPPVQFAGWANAPGSSTHVVETTVRWEPRGIATPVTRVLPLQVPDQPGDYSAYFSVQDACGAVGQTGVPRRLHVIP